MAKKDTTVVTNTGNGGVWFILGILVVVVGIGAYFMFGQGAPGSTGKDVDVKIELPKPSVD